MKKPHVMFLDFDGPLFSERALMLPENHEFAQDKLLELKLHPMVSYWYADPVAIAMLIELYRYRPYQIVVSSTWAEPHLHDKEQIENLLKHNGLGVPLHKNWRTPRENHIERIDQVKEWLDNNEYSDYVILDDNLSGVSFENNKALKETGLDKNKILLVNYDEGILYKDFCKLQAIMATWN